MARPSHSRRRGALVPLILAAIALTLPGCARVNQGAGSTANLPEPERGFDYAASLD